MAADDSNDFGRHFERLTRHRPASKVELNSMVRFCASPRMLGLSLIPLALCGLSAVAVWEIYQDTGVWDAGLVTLASLSLLGYGLMMYLWGTSSDQVHKVLANQVNYERQIEMTLINQAPGAVGNFSAVEIERHRAQQAFNAEQLRYLQEERNITLTQQEAERVRAHERMMQELRQRHEEREARADRNWKGEQAKSDRDHEMDKLLKRLDHEMAMWKERIEVEYRGEPDRMREELDAWELERMAREAIDQEDDEDKKLRYIKAFEKRLSRRSA